MNRIMWREPRIHELDAPPEFTELINESIFYNSEGNLVGAHSNTIVQYLMALLLSWLFFTSFLFALISGLFQLPFLSVPQIIFSFALLAVLLAIFYIWGWRSYRESWYHFDDDNEIFTVIQRPKGQWESIEVPYERVNNIEWSGGTNGFAIIHTAGFEFPTTRADSQRFASVTELWNQLARFDTKMSNWPIVLKCLVCEREFGHHIGTAQCPFDKSMLIDPDIKGRIDPEDLHPDDQTRV